MRMKVEPLFSSSRFRVTVDAPLLHKLGDTCAIIELRVKVRIKQGHLQRADISWQFKKKMLTQEKHKNIVLALEEAIIAYVYKLQCKFKFLKISYFMRLFIVLFYNFMKKIKNVPFGRPDWHN